MKTQDRKGGEHPSRRHRADEEILAAILAEIIDRRRSGETPSAEEYIARHPHLREAIEAHLATIDVLEGDAPGLEPASGGPARAEPGEKLGKAIDALPSRLQRAIYLRHFEKLPWAEVARRMGEAEDALRRSYARALRDLVALCSPGAG